MSEMASIGDNSGAVDAGRLRSFIERAERLLEDKKAIAEDVKEVLLRARSAGYDAKMIRKLIALRAQDPAKRAEEEAILEVYRNAIGLSYPRFPGGHDHEAR